MIYAPAKKLFLIDLFIESSFLLLPFGAEVRTITQFHFCRTLDFSCMFFLFLFLYTGFVWLVFFGDYFWSCFQVLPGLRWRFSFNTAGTRLAPWKIRNAFIFIQSDFAVKQTLIRFCSLPVNFRGISFAPIALRVVFPIMSNHTPVSPIAITQFRG